MIFAFFLYVLLRGSEKPCFFIVFYNKVLKKSSFLAFFGHFLEANLGPQRVIFSLFWTLGVGSPLSGLGWSGLGAGLGVPFSGRLGTPNPGTRFLHLLTLFYSRFLLTALLDFTHLQRYRCAGTRSTAVSSTLKIWMRNFRILFSTPFSHFIHFIMLLLLCYGAHLVFWSGMVSSRNTHRAEHPAEARQKLRESSTEAQLIHSHAARSRES